MLRSIKYGLHGAVLAGLIAAPVLWSSVDKSVHLVVDGKSTTVSTTAGNVGDVLASQHLDLTSHDLLAPSSSSSVKDGMDIVVRRGRLLHLSVDGQSKQIWTTAPTVNEALAELGYTTQDFVSVSRSQRLPLDPTSIDIRTPRVVTVVHDGQREQITTTDATVGQLLTEIGATPNPADKLSAAPASALTNGQVITLQRVTRRTISRLQALKFSVTKENDSSLDKGTSKVTTKGKNGTARVLFSIVYVDGKAVGETRLGAKTVTAPRNQVVAIGTKKITKINGYTLGDVPNAPAPDPGTAKAIAKQLLADRGWGDDQYDCLVQMWKHESGWRTNAANPSGAYGIPQALPGSKMASAGSDWRTNPATQIKWGLKYIASRYDTPCGAWAFWQAHSYY